MPIKYEKESSFLSSEEIRSIEEWTSEMKKYPLLIPIVKRKIAQRTLEIPHKNIGNGLNRMVYDLGNGYVLKIALSEIGLISNAQEFRLYHFSHPDIQQYLCPVMEKGQGWIVMKKMDHKASMNLVNLQKLSDLIIKFLLHGIVPVDLKLANIALTHDNEMVVIDYGLFIKTLYGKTVDSNDYIHSE
ncbi:hypothetical protein ACQKP0_13795 [Heyndrickxia sp. NPDC080065]|uniref:hypothetical protein n=1 Tax=Heyndrickxia sp. NPDC080065 TaxID=3390568 RepID=UPI003D01DC82